MTPQVVEAFREDGLRLRAAEQVAQGYPRQTPQTPAGRTRGAVAGGRPTRPFG
jgi:hypothetical protein